MSFSPASFAALSEASISARPIPFERNGGSTVSGPSSSAFVFPIRIGKTKALLLGPLTVEPPFRSNGIGRALMEASLKAAKDAGEKLILLVGDEPYYGRLGFKKVPRGRVKFPGPVDPERVLVTELVAGAFDGVEGTTRPDYSAQK